MSDTVAACYCDMSLSQFRALVEAQKLPAGRKIFGTSMVRWLKYELQAAIAAEYGVLVDINSQRGAASKSGGKPDLDKEFGLG
jgi:hypothetical protein